MHHATYIANNIRITIILFFGCFHLQMNKTSVTPLYLYAFLFTLSAWLCDVTFTADRSCTLFGCGSILTAGKRLSLKNLNVIIRAIN